PALGFSARERVVVIAPEDPVGVVPIGGLRTRRVDVHPAGAAAITLIALLGVEGREPVMSEQARPGRVLHEFAKVEVVGRGGAEFFAKILVPNVAVLTEAAVGD